MSPSEIQAESKRLRELADSLVNQPRGDDSELTPLGLAIVLGYAGVVAALPAFITSFFLGADKAVIVFSSLIVFFGCFLIKQQLEVVNAWQGKQFDAINALRLSIIDLSNRTSNTDTSN